MRRRLTGWPARLAPDYSFNEIPNPASPKIRQRSKKNCGDELGMLESFSFVASVAYLLEP